MRKVLLLLFLSFAATAVSGAEIFTVVRGNRSYPPNEMMDRHGKLTGVHIDTVRAVAKQLGLDIRFLSLPWKRAQDKIKNGEADAITYIGKTSAREKFVYYNKDNILTQDTVNFICLIKTCDKIKFKGDLNALKGLRIVLQLGFNYGAYFDNNENLTKIFVDAPQQLYELLVKNRADVAVQAMNSFQYNMKLDKFRRYQQKVRPLPHPLKYTDAYIGFAKSKATQELGLRFAEAFQKFKKTKQHERILKKYSSQNY